MKSTIRLMWIIAMVALIGFSFAACGDPDGGEDTELTGTIIIDFDVEEEEDGSVPVGTELTAKYSGDEEGVTYEWKKDGTKVGTGGLKYTTDAAGNYTVTVSATGKNSKTSKSVTAWWVVDPKYAPYHGVWKWEGPKSGTDARDEFITITFNKRTGDSTFKYHDTQKEPNDSLTCSIDKWETKTKPATPTGYDDGYKLTCFMDEIVGNPGFVPKVGESFTYNVFLLTAGKGSLVRSIPNADTLAGDTNPRVYVKQEQ